MTTEPVGRPEGDAETATTPARALEAPLPPYAQPGGSYPSVPMSPTAPSPPPARDPSATQPPSVTDAMVEISMPPLATALAESTPAPGATASTTAAVMPPPATGTITCPECGTIAQVTLNRRESFDFCRTCDFPLFWTPTNVVRDPSDTTDDSLRRLPGQAGRATVASLPCPFCYEPNALSAQTCIRCHRPMHPVEQPPPAPVYVPPPAPVVVEPPKKVAWWVWALLALGAAALIVLIVLISTGTIG